MKFDPDKLKKAQIEAHKGTVELAKLAGMTPAYLSKLRNGKKQPSDTAVAKLSEALRIPLEALYTPAQAASSPDARPELSPEENAILAAVRTLDGTGVLMVLTFAQALSASGSKSASEKAADIQRDREDRKRG
jgi:transcriptional regulator with XRE-family HTH domain